MNKKLYVGNLPYTATEDQVRELFSQVGEITEVALIIDRETGRPKGFGFVEMATPESAQEAIKRFNGFNFQNRPLTVNEARPREGGAGGGAPRSGGFGGGSGGGSRGGGGYGDRDRGFGGGGGDRGGFGGGGDRDRGGRGGFDRERRGRF